MIRKMDAYTKAGENGQSKPKHRVSPKKILLVAAAVNLVFMVAYLSLYTLSASAADDKAPQTQAAARKEAPQDARAQLDAVKQREEILRVRERELQLLESRIDEKIKRLSELETNVKAEIAMYKGISNERTKHLVKIYSSMKPNAAATLMNQMDVEVATEVILGMKGEIAGGILAYMEPAKAAAITKRLMSSRKVSSSAPQAVPQSAPQGAAGQAPASAMADPSAEPGTLAQTGLTPAPKPAHKARPKALAKKKAWSPSLQVAAQTEPAAVIPQSVNTPAGGAGPQTPARPAPQASAPQTVPQAAPQAVPQAQPQTAPQASAKQASTQALAQVTTGQPQ